MAYGYQMGYMTNVVTWPQRCCVESAVGYPSNSLASCAQSTRKFYQNTLLLLERGNPVMCLSDGTVKLTEFISAV